MSSVPIQTADSERAGENNETTIKCKNKYYGCHLVVVRGGLEDEYESWLKQQQGSEKYA